jgi:dienelactone hydrolase
MATLETPLLSPIKPFLEPVVRAVNYAQQVRRTQRLYMIGISGGGWTTTLAAAVDPRIKVSVPVAGSLPHYLRPPGGLCTTAGDRGDFEQNHPPLFAIADYLDLYILGSHGLRRGQLQVLNQYDSCCFNGPRGLAYRGVLKDLMRERRLGRYDQFLDASHQQHTISDHAMEEAIYPFMRFRRLPRGVSGTAGVP